MRFCVIIMLMIFGNFHDGVKSNPLPTAVNGYIYTPGIGHGKILRLITKEGDLAIVNSKTVGKGLFLDESRWRYKRASTVKRHRRHIANAWASGWAAPTGHVAALALARVNGAWGWAGVLGYNSVSADALAIDAGVRARASARASVSGGFTNAQAITSINGWF